jgi:hypothetical protein
LLAVRNKPFDKVSNGLINMSERFYLLGVDDKNANNPKPVKVMRKKRNSEPMIVYTFVN